MTQEKKQILLQDLCARLPYGVKVEINGYYIHVLTGIDGDTISTDRGINYPLRLVKPFLRPLSSMTEEERKDFEKAARKDVDISLNEVNRQYKSKLDQYAPLLSAYNKLDWLNAHHFDFRNIIGIGLGIESPEGMY